jgi:hypothetical protein
VLVAVATLIASGLIHDAFAFAGRQTLSATMTRLFVFAGAFQAVWIFVIWSSNTLRIKVGLGQLTWVNRLGQVAARLGVAAALVAVAIVWG